MKVELTFLKNKEAIATTVCEYERLYETIKTFEEVGFDEIIIQTIGD